MPHNLQIPTGSRWPEELRLSQLFGDALRLRVLGECNTRELSPRSFHAMVGGAPLPKVTEAFELLAQYEWLECTRTEDGERFYRGTGAPIVSKEAYEGLPDSTRALLISRIVESLTERVRESMKAGTIFARSDAHLTWTSLELDRQGWEALTERLDSLFLWLAAEQERAGTRMEETGEEPIPLTVALFGFESPKDPERKFS